jgi:uncharacterized protein (DUF983 family)
MFGRAALLRCPRCGGRGVMRSWFKMAERCPTCGLALERGERSDFWIGAYVFNLAFGEGIAFGVLVIWMVASAPNQPWTRIEVVGLILAILLPLMFFPFSRTLWLAWDLSFRPAEPGDVGGVHDVNAPRWPNDHSSRK